MAKNKNGQKKYKQGALPYVQGEALQLGCLGEMLTGGEAEEFIAKIPLNPMATPEMIQALKHETEPVDCVFIVDYREGSKGVYADSAFESIANKILTAKTFVPAGYGHQEPSAVPYEGRELYGTVIGVLLDKEAGKIYGI